MEYSFFDRGDEELIEISELPCESGIAFAVRTTSYEAESAEVVELAIVDFSGKVLFNQKVKPQNTETWDVGEASGNIGPADVEDAPELFQFEEEIDGIFKNAETVVASHLAFAQETIEQSWVSLPDFKGTDLVELFCKTHSAKDYPGNPATAASLPGIADYYGLAEPDGTAVYEAALTARCYQALVDEHKQQREAKGEEHWRRYDESKADERAEQARIDAVKRKREHRFNQMNGLLWFAGAIIFTSLVIQLYQRGGDPGIMIIAGVIAVFAFVRGVVNFRK